MIQTALSKGIFRLIQKRTLHHFIVLYSPSYQLRKKLLDDIAYGWVQAEQKSGGVHPDILSLKPLGKSGIYTVESIREVVEESALTPFQSLGRVFCIEEGERLSLPAANALLKVLEEPSQGVLFLMTVSRLEKLLPTILSRAQVFRLPGKEVCKNTLPVLIEQEKVDLQKADTTSCDAAVAVATAKEQSAVDVDRSRSKPAMYSCTLPKPDSPLVCEEVRAALFSSPFARPSYHELVCWSGKMSVIFERAFKERKSQIEEGVGKDDEKEAALSIAAYQIGEEILEGLHAGWRAMLVVRAQELSGHRGERRFPDDTLLAFHEALRTLALQIKFEEICLQVLLYLFGYIKGSCYDTCTKYYYGPPT